MKLWVAGGLGRRGQVGHRAYLRPTYWTERVLLNFLSKSILLFCQANFSRSVPTAMMASSPVPFATISVLSCATAALEYVLLLVANLRRERPERPYKRRISRVRIDCFGECPTLKNYRRWILSLKMLCVSKALFFRPFLSQTLECFL